MWVVIAFFVVFLLLGLFAEALPTLTKEAFESTERASPRTRFWTYTIAIPLFCVVILWSAYRIITTFQW